MTRFKPKKLVPKGILLKDRTFKEQPSQNWWFERGNTARLVFTLYRNYVTHTRNFITWLQHSLYSRVYFLRVLSSKCKINEYSIHCCNFIESRNGFMNTNTCKHLHKYPWNSIFYCNAVKCFTAFLDYSHFNSLPCFHPTLHSPAPKRFHHKLPTCLIYTQFS